MVVGEMFLVYLVCEGVILVVIIDNLLVNVLGVVVCWGLMFVIEEGEVDVGVVVILVIGVGCNFIGGVDICEFGKLL